MKVKKQMELYVTNTDSSTSLWRIFFIKLDENVEGCHQINITHMKLQWKSFKRHETFLNWNVSWLQRFGKEIKSSVILTEKKQWNWSHFFLHLLFAPGASLISLCSFYHLFILCPWGKLSSSLIYVNLFNYFVFCKLLFIFGNSLF